MLRYCNDVEQSKCGTMDQEGSTAMAATGSYMANSRIEDCWREKDRDTQREIRIFCATCNNIVGH